MVKPKFVLKILKILIAFLSGCKIKSSCCNSECMNKKVVVCPKDCDKPCCLISSPTFEEDGEDGQIIK